MTTEAAQGAEVTRGDREAAEHALEVLLERYPYYEDEHGVRLFDADLVRLAQLIASTRISAYEQLFSMLQLEVNAEWERAETRCLQSDMQRIREKLAYEAGLKAGAEPFELLMEDAAMQTMRIGVSKHPGAVYSCHLNINDTFEGRETWSAAARALCEKLGLLAKEAK